LIAAFVKASVFSPYSFRSSMLLECELNKTKRVSAANGGMEAQPGHSGSGNKF